MDYGVILSMFLAQTVFPIAGALVLAMAGWALKKLADKYGAEGLLTHQVQIESLVIAAIGFAEEVAKAKAAGAEKITGQEKLDLALGWLMKRAPELDPDAAGEWIEAMLGRVRGAGATGDEPIVVP